MQGMVGNLALMLGAISWGCGTVPVMPLTASKELGRCKLYARRSRKWSFSGGLGVLE
jgi:hypothetical protein